MFSRDRKAKTGRQSWCKLCVADRPVDTFDAIGYSVGESIWKALHPDKMNEYRERYKNPVGEYEDLRV